MTDTEAISNLKSQSSKGKGLACSFVEHAAGFAGVLLPGEKVVDLFCGAGGWDAAANRLGIAVDFAVNHDAVAIETHKANHPGCVHHQGDAWRAKPREVVGLENVGKVGLLLASAACTTHSNARGSAPISPRVHMLGWCIARWMKDVAPRVVMIENVPEWKSWGPLTQLRWKREDKGGGSNFTWEKLDRKGKVVGRVRGPKWSTPAGRAWAKARREKGTGGGAVRPVLVQCSKRKGQHFRRWWRYCESLGYVMEMRVQDAPDYGAACRRKRLFIVARRDGVAITWPEKTHGEARLDRMGDHGEGAASHDVSARPRRGGADDGVDGQGTRRGDRGDDQGQQQLCSARGAGHAGQATDRGHQAGDRGLRKYRTAAECIDWSDLGSSIFERSKPLKPKTLARIAEGVRRYVLNDPNPFVLRITQTGGVHVGGSVTSVAGCGPTQTTREDLALAVPVVAPQNTGVYGQRPDEPGPTITTKGHQAAITPVVQLMRHDHAGKDCRDPLPTITAGNGPGRGSAAGHAMGVSTPVLVTTGYGEREGQRPRAHSVRDLLGTCVNGAKQGLATPVLMNNTSGHTGARAGSPMPTITTGGQGAVVAPVLSHFRHGGGQAGKVDEPLATPTSGGNHASLVAALMVEYYGSGSGTTGRSAKEPLGTPTTVDRHGLVSVVISGVEYVIVDILFRMLRPSELARAMGFPETYVWPKAKRDATRMIGNAVQVDHAAALIGAVFPGMRGVGEGRKAGAA